jgi:hypothetical protein
MDIKKPLILLIGLLLISTTVGAYISMNGITIPDAQVTLNAVYGTDSYFIVTLSNVPAGNDITNGVYPGWCMERFIEMPKNTNLKVRLYDSYDQNLLPVKFQNPNWDNINWILNNRGVYSMSNIQKIVWYYLNNYPWNSLSTNAKNLVINANTSGEGFTPECGDIIAIVCVPERNDTQCVFIEFTDPCSSSSCRWTGGGTIGTNRDPRVTHGFELHCDVNQLPNNLEVNWGGDHFHLDVLTAVKCSDDPAIDPTPPRAGCDTIHGWGDGKYNGASGYHVEFIFTDAGEPGKVDWAWIHIIDSGNNTVMEVSGFLKSGNQQAHFCTGIDA